MIALDDSKLTCCDCGTEIGAVRFCWDCGASQTGERSSPLYILDGPTGLSNEVFLRALAAHELERALRYGHPLALIAIRIDNAGGVREEDWHAAMNSVGRLISTSVRETDTVGILRPWVTGVSAIFAVLLPETAPSGADVAARKVCARLRADKLEPLEISQLDVRFAAAAYVPGTARPDDLVDTVLDQLTDNNTWTCDEIQTGSGIS